MKWIHTDPKGGSLLWRSFRMFLPVFLLLLLCNSRVSGEEKEKEAFRIEYFGYNTCAACAPEEEFYDIIRSQIGDLREEIPYVIYEYNTFHQEDRQKLSKRREELDIPDNNGVWPIVIAGDHVLIGLEETEKQIREILLTESERNVSFLPSDTVAEESSPAETKSDLQEIFKTRLSEQLGEISDEDSVILYFSTLSCRDCLKMKELLDGLEREIVLDTGKKSQIRVCEISIAEEENVPVLWQFFESYQVPQEERMVPILFFSKGFLPGVKAAEQNLLTELKKGSMRDFLSVVLKSEASEKVTVTGRFAMAVTGFINGLNPCGASMLLMLLAAGMMLDKRILKVGLSYLAGKFLSYFAMGFGLYQLFLQIDHSILSKMSRSISGVSAVLFLILAIMYFIDFWNVRKKEYGKIRMQLPASLRRWNHKQIEKFTESSGKALLPAIFVLGLIISAGEFFCTGQVYLAAIMYMMKENAGNADTILTFLIYIAAMCIPSLILVIVIDKTGNVIRTSDRTLEWMPAVKLLTALIFLAAAVVMLL